MQIKAYIGTFTDKKSEGIYLLDINGETYTKTLVDKCLNPSYLCISQNKYLYAVVEAGSYKEHDGGGVRAYKINEDYTLSFINEQFMDGGYPCHVTTNSANSHLFCSNFAGGFANVFSLNNDGSINPCEKKLVQKDDNEPLRPSRLHQSFFNDEENAITFTDYGLDRLVSYQFLKNEGVLDEKYILKLPKDSGPRHSVLYKNQFIYTCGELSNQVYVSEITNNQKTPIKLISTHTTLKHGDEIKSYCGAIRLFDDKILVSNRGENNLCLFKILSDNTLELITHIDCGGDFPRDVNITSDAKYIFCANQKSGTVDILKNFDDYSRIMSVPIDDAVCVVFANF